MSMAKAWDIFKTERSEDSVCEIWQSEDDIISFFFTIYLVLKTEDLNTAFILDVKIQNMSSCAWSPYYTPDDWALDVRYKSMSGKGAKENSNYRLM